MSSHPLSILFCPDCNRQLPFTHGATNLVQCTGCGSVIYRKPDNTVINKPQLTIPSKVEVIQPGTTGTWENKSFTVLGRFRAWFEEAVFNYWTIRFDNDELGWLAEGYGLYSVVMAATLKSEPSNSEIRQMKVGSTCDLDDTHFVVEKKQNCYKWDIEGELFIPQVQSSFRVFELTAESGKHITLFEFDKYDLLVYATFYVAPESLALQNLRREELTGKTFTCTDCKEPITVKTFPYAQSCACKSCGSWYTMENGMDYKKSRKAKTSAIPSITIGTTGTIRGIDYEVIGFTKKEEINEYHSKWMEYTLYNPFEGYAFLSEYDGHWIYLREEGDSPPLLDEQSKEIIQGKEEFELFNSYNYKVIDARGEFPYNIFNNEETKVKEYINPPQVWIRDKDNKEGIKWFLGHHIAPKELKKALNLTHVPWRVGVGAVQPTGYINPWYLLRVGLAGILLLMLMHTLIGFTKKERLLFDNTVHFPDSANQVSFVTNKFKFEKRSSNVRIDVDAPVSNSWLELGVSMVNTETGKEYTAEKGVEYYSGYSEGEYWTEGSTSSSIYFTRIPAGTYLFQIQGTRDNLGYVVPEFKVEALYDVPIRKNLWIPVIFFAVLVGGRFAIFSYRENSRWSNSPFSNYHS